MTRDIREASLDDIIIFLEAHKEKAFRAKQVYQWLWEKEHAPLTK